MLSYVKFNIFISIRDYNIDIRKKILDFTANTGNVVDLKCIAKNQKKI